MVYNAHHTKISDPRVKTHDHGVFTLEHKLLLVQLGNSVKT